MLCNTDSSCLLIHITFQVVRKLRERGEAILLFGETDYEAYVRLKKLETLEPDGKKVKIVKKRVGNVLHSIE